MRLTRNHWVVSKGQHPHWADIVCSGCLNGGKEPEEWKRGMLGVHLLEKKKNSTEPEQMKFGFPLCKSAVHRSIAFVNSSRQKLLQRKDMANGNG